MLINSAGSDAVTAAIIASTLQRCLQEASYGPGLAFGTVASANRRLSIEPGSTDVNAALLMGSSLYRRAAAVDDAAGMAEANMMGPLAGCGSLRSPVTGASAAASASQHPLQMLSLLAQASSATESPSRTTSHPITDVSLSSLLNAFHNPSFSVPSNRTSSKENIARASPLTGSIQATNTMDYSSQYASIAAAAGDILSSPSALENPIRTDHVEAALRSQPQRGRKRHNLSEVERQELTRKRNREHAKFTRLKKKARYEELLDVEQELQELKYAQRVKDKRKAAIGHFIVALDSWLCSFLKKNGKNSSNAKDKKTSDTVRLVTTLRAIMEDDATFEFGPMTSSSCCDCTKNVELQHQLDEFKDFIITQIISRLGKYPIIPSISLSLQGGSIDGIALNDLNSGYVTVEVHLEESILLLRAIVRFDFPDASSSSSSSSSSSCKIKAVDWTTIHDDAIETVSLQKSTNDLVAADAAAAVSPECEAALVEKRRGHNFG